MKHFLILGGLCMAAALIAPVTLKADDDHRHDKRYYDRDGKDYHQWDDHEDRAYRLYLQEHHREYRVFPKTNAAQQREYFLWRHAHPDGVLFKLEVH